MTRKTEVKIKGWLGWGILLDGMFVLILSLRNVVVVAFPFFLLRLKKQEKRQTEKVNKILKIKKITKNKNDVK